jgi:hypothetical protein
MLMRYETNRALALTSSVIGAGFLLGAFAHLFGWLPLETASGELREPRVLIPTAVLVLCGVLLLGAAFSLRTIRASGFRNALVAHGVTLVSLIIALLVLASALEVSVLSLGFYVTMLVLVGLNFAGLWRARPRNPLKRAQHEIAARLY